MTTGGLTGARADATENGWKNIIDQIDSVGRIIIVMSDGVQICRNIGMGRAGRLTRDALPDPVKILWMNAFTLGNGKHGLSLSFAYERGIIRLGLVVVGIHHLVSGMVMSLPAVRNTLFWVRSLLYNQTILSLYFELGKRFIKYRIPFLRESLMPMKLTVASTFLCNHRCKMCDIWKVYRTDKEKLQQEITRDDFTTIFNQLQASLLYLDWGGGEPFLRQDLPDILADAARLCPHLSSVVITTNGLLTERILEYTARVASAMKGQIVAIGVSLDGTRDNHNFIRGRDDAYDCAVATLTGLRSLSGKFPNIEPKISYTISYRNAGQLEIFDREVLRPLGLNMGDVGFGVEHVGGLFQTAVDPGKAVGRVSETEFKELAKKDIAYAISHLREDNLRLLQKLKSVYRKFFLQEIPSFLDAPKHMVIPCSATRSSLYLDPYGNLFPCIVWSRRLGHFKDGIAQLLRSEMVRKTRKDIDAAQCPVCWNACEAIPSLLSSSKLIGCVTRSLADANTLRSLRKERR